MSPDTTTYLHAGVTRVATRKTGSFASKRNNWPQKEKRKPTSPHPDNVPGWEGLNTYIPTHISPPYPRRELSNSLLPAPSSVTMLLHVLGENPIQLHQQQTPCLELTRILQVGTELHNIQAWLFSIFIVICAPHACLPWPFLLGRRGQCRDVTSPHRLESRSPAVPWVRSGKLQQPSLLVSVSASLSPRMQETVSCLLVSRFLFLHPGQSFGDHGSLCCPVSVPENFDGKITNT